MSCSLSVIPLLSLGINCCLDLGLFPDNSMLRELVINLQFCSKLVACSRHIFFSFVSNGIIGKVHHLYFLRISIGILSVSGYSHTSVVATCYSQRIPAHSKFIQPLNSFSPFQTLDFRYLSLSLVQFSYILHYLV